MAVIVDDCYIDVMARDGDIVVICACGEGSRGIVGSARRGWRASARSS
jgi:hypothetical protein